MNSYSFFSSMLRFVAGKLEADGGAAADARTAAMTGFLRRLADRAETSSEGTPTLEVPADGLEVAARALAGFAALLQKSVLPEAVAHGNKAGEIQIRWAVDAAMESVNLLLSRAAAAEGRPVSLTLPPSPD